MDFEKAFPDTLELETPRILMRKIREEDIPVFQHLGADRELWKYFKYDLSSPRKMEWYIRDALEQKKKRQRMPFTIIDKDTKEICGTSSFGNISFEDGRLEIGWSFLGKAFQGTGITKHRFFVMTNYAFEVLKMERVEVKTDATNERAKGALLKSGFIPEGVLRSYSPIEQENRRRDAIYFSLLRTEWPERMQQFYPELVL